MDNFRSAKKCRDLSPTTSDENEKEVREKIAEDEGEPMTVAAELDLDESNHSADGGVCG